MVGDKAIRNTVACGADSSGVYSAPVIESAGPLSTTLLGAVRRHCTASVITFAICPVQFDGNLTQVDLMVGAMRISMIPVTLALLGSMVTFANESALQTTASKHAAKSATEWDYSNQRGPEHWSELSPEYVLARIGGSQSPVDIQTQTTIGADLPKLIVEPHEQPLHLLNNGHTVEAICPGAATLRFGAQSYNLLQFHFHAPSEHTIDGEHAEVELHFVHSDGEGHLAVIAVLFFEGDVEQPEIAAMLTRDSVSHPGDDIVDESTYINARDFLPASLDYYTYDGSLTTPPATEGVRWFVLKQPLHMTREQIEAIDNVYYSNNRPTQPLNARFVLTRR